jgi:hypothetical protein
LTAADEERAAAGDGPRVVVQNSTLRDIIFDQPSPLEQAERRSLIDLRNNVRRIWITGVLETSVQRLAGLDVGKAQADLSPNPFDSIIELPNQTRRLLPPGQSLAPVFEEFGRAMLILGDPGSGKTTSLLQLARHLLDRAANDSRQPTPVVLNLSTWKGGGLKDWLIEELRVRYLVPAAQGDKWLTESRLILLLDGLDEVSREHQLACVHAINAFLNISKAGGLAVCCRREDYAALPEGLLVNVEISVQPLTQSQIESYLGSAGHRMDALAMAIRLDEPLQALAQSPLMLNVMSLAYDTLTVTDLTNANLDTVEERRSHLFTTYVKRMFERRPQAARLYPAERTLPLLNWLARQMRGHSQSQFLIERLQPDWLDSPAERRLYIMVSRLLCGAVLGILLGAMLQITWNTFTRGQAGSLPEAREVLTVLGAGLLLGSLNGILIGLMDIWRFERHRRGAAVRNSRQSARLVIEVTGYSVALALLSALLIGIVDSPESGLIMGIVVGPVFGVFFGIHGGGRDMNNDVHTVEALHWSWTGLRRSAVRGLLAGAALGIVIALVLQLADSLAGDQTSAAQWLRDGLLAARIGAIVGLAVGAAYGSLESRIVSRKTTPNQGIELSARNAIRAGVAAGLMVTVLLAVAAATVLPAAQVADLALIGGLFFGMVAALWTGGFDVIQHYTLRVILAVRGYAPLRYARFLDCAASLIFLQKAGGGYLFVHRLLLEHFADHERAAASAPTATEAMPALSRS